VENQTILNRLLQKQQKQQQAQKLASGKLNKNNNKIFPNIQQPQHAYNVNYAQIHNQHQMPNNMSSIEYQKWLLTMGRQQLVENVNRDLNSKVFPPPPPSSNHYNFLNHNNQNDEVDARYSSNGFNGHHNFHHPHHQQVPPQVQPQTKPMSEVERIKLELLGYQREIEMMQKKREQNKLLKQQQQLQQQQQQQQQSSTLNISPNTNTTTVNATSSATATATTPSQITTIQSSTSNLVHTISPTENQIKLNRYLKFLGALLQKIDYFENRCFFNTIKYLN
jgi:hypothetical protein